MYGLRFMRTAETPYGASPTGSPPLSGYARLAWFPDGYRVSICPYRSALRPNPASRAHRPRYSAFPTAVGHWLTKGRRSASLPVRRRSSPPCEEGNHAPQYGRVHLSCRARSVTTRRFAGVTRSTRYRLPVVPPRAEDTGSPWGGEERSGAFSHGPHPYRHRHPHILGL